MYTTSPQKAQCMRHAAHKAGSAVAAAAKRQAALQHRQHALQHRQHRLQAATARATRCWRCCSACTRCNSACSAQTAATECSTLAAVPSSQAVLVVLQRVQALQHRLQRAPAATMHEAGSTWGRRRCCTSLASASIVADARCRRCYSAGQYIHPPTPPYTLYFARGEFSE